MPRKPYISSGISFEPLEETLDVKPLGSSLSIAIPKENAFQENRIALSPDAVGVLVNNGHTVSVENKAGEGAHFSDRDYAEAGAIIVFDKKEIFRSELVVKSAPVSNEEPVNDRYTVNLSIFGFSLTREFNVKIDQATRNIYIN